MQVPLRLAWAITIHKSQGMTLDAAEIDLSDAFEPGMGYVALSRVRGLSGLKLLGLNEIALKVHPRVLQVDQNLKEKSAEVVNDLLRIGPEALTKLKRETLSDRFFGVIENEDVQSKKIVKTKKLKVKEKVKNKEVEGVSSHEVTRQMVADGRSLKEIAELRSLKIETILNHLEKLKGIGKLPNIDHIKNVVSPDDFASIYEEFTKSRDGKLAPIFGKFEGAYSFETLKTVKLFVV